LERKIYYFTSIIAGGVLLASELLVTRLIGPFFGASLYVWAATIGTTLAGLATGYYYAGKVSGNPDLRALLIKITLISSVYLLVLPFFSSLVMRMLMGLEIIPGILISTLIFNLPLFFLMGLFSPTIIQLLSRSDEDAGNYAGKIYGLSTISGVIFITLTGIYLLPTIGSKFSLVVCAALMFITAVIQFLYSRTNE
jgi:hypothetical protein